MRKKAKLEWGETPWDNWSKEELLREVQRMYLALEASQSVLRQSKRADVDWEWNAWGFLFWGKEGSGGRALEMGNQIFARYEEYGDSMYRAFFRYAADLLFDSSEYEIGFGWSVCSVCGEMRAPISSGKRSCANNGCTGIMRALTWDDLKKEEDSK